jgi:hypothetical protein
MSMPSSAQLFAQRGRPFPLPPVLGMGLTVHVTAVNRGRRAKGVGVTYQRPFWDPYSHGRRLGL